MLKVVLDTNIFVAGYLSKSKLGYPCHILDRWRNGEFTLVVSPQILEEIVAKLLEKGVAEDLLVDLVATIGQIALHIPGSYETCTLNEIDPDDNMFLAAALESNADYIVSYDAKSLLPLKHFHGTQILLPELFIRQFLGVDVEDQEAAEVAELEAELDSLAKETWQRRQQPLQDA
ncbi:MAG: putative toxin-antitoxin system toxin component, PIN family [Candidatus Obscuribacter sp.]|nr:putative toxin-antitoxin system toxin component, PIN family [Candidatus Obscuribacter sp.]